MHSNSAPDVRRASSQPRRRYIRRTAPARVWLASMFLAGLLVAPSTAVSAPMDLRGGGSRVESHDAGRAQVYRLTAAANGAVSRPAVYLNGASTAS